jgi:large subunit ribosomal protein L24
MLIRKNDRVALRKAVTGAKDVSGRPLSKEARGSVGRVLVVDGKKGRVLVEGINFVYRHVRPSQKQPQGGRIAKEAPVDISSVMLYCEKCQRGVKVRKERVTRTDPQGKRITDIVRHCKRCNEVVGEVER